MGPGGLDAGAPQGGPFAEGEGAHVQAAQPAGHLGRVAEAGPAHPPFQAGLGHLAPDPLQILPVGRVGRAQGVADHQQVRVAPPCDQQGQGLHQHVDALGAVDEPEVPDQGAVRGQPQPAPPGLPLEPLRGRHVQGVAQGHLADRGGPSASRRPRPQLAQVVSLGGDDPLAGAGQVAHRRPAQGPRLGEQVRHPQVVEGGHHRRRAPAALPCPRRPIQEGRRWMAPRSWKAPGWYWMCSTSQPPLAGQAGHLPEQAPVPAPYHAQDLWLVVTGRRRRGVWTGGGGGHHLHGVAPGDQLPGQPGGLVAHPPYVRRVLPADDPDAHQDGRLKERSASG